MTVLEMMDDLQKKAQNDRTIQDRLLATRREANPVSAFCRECQILGYEIYQMDLIQAGEEFCAQIKRSTNGGRENSPMLEGEDDLYEMFFAALETSI